MTQGTEEWLRARCGKVTASRISDMMAKTKTGWGASRRNYAAELVTERLTGEPAPSYTSPAMQYGIECEPEARAAYSFLRNVDVEEVGFIEHPTVVMAGASPDGVVVQGNGLVEIKCPNTAQHIDTLLRETIDGDYVQQMQFQMACTRADWCDFVSYDRRLPGPMQLWIKRVHRNDAEIERIEKEVRIFLAEIDETVATLRKRYALEEAA